MRILLVQPTTKYPDLKPLRSKTRWLVGMTLPYLAGLTPKGIQVDLVLGGTMILTGPLLVSSMTPS